MLKKEYENIIEGILFLSGSEGVTIAEILLTLNIDEGHAKNILANLKQKYDNQGGLDLIHTTNNYKLVTKSTYYDYYKKYVNLNNEITLGNSTLEVLAIIAYKQPITKYEIEQLKGVSVNYHLNQLLTKNLVYVSGRRKEIGTPNIFSTTDNFLDFIGINSLHDLPDLKTFKLNPENNFLLNFEEFDFKKLSDVLLTSDNTIQMKQLDQDVLQEIEEIQELKVSDDIFNLKNQTQLDENELDENALDENETLKKEDEFENKDE